MGTFSIWHWLIVLAILLTPIAMVGYARSNLSRAGFTVRFVPALIASVGAGAIAEDMLPAAIAAIVLHFLNFRWTALRLNDVRWSRWWALLWVLWPVGFVLAIVLCFKRTGAEDLAPVFD